MELVGMFPALIWDLVVVVFAVRLYHHIDPPSALTHASKLAAGLDNPASEYRGTLYHELHTEFAPVREKIVEFDWAGFQSVAKGATSPL